MPTRSLIRLVPPHLALAPFLLTAALAAQTPRPPLTRPSTVELRRADDATLRRTVLPWWTAADAARPGAGSFRRFAPRATGASTVNAYLLAYLSTAVYADYGLQPLLGLSNAETTLLKRNRTRFRDAFERVVRPLFINTADPSDGPPRISALINGNDREGYDPDAIVIGTDSAVYVVFRGTDAVTNARGPGGEEFAEWFKTDFQFNRIAPGNGLRGTVHAGFWNSLTLIRDRLADTVAAYGGAEKPVWVTGHSLGGAHGLLFAGWLRSQRRNIRLQGVYTFAAPHVGDDAFRVELEGLGRAQVQRHEFADDPATAFPPSSTLGFGAIQLGYAPIGTRVFYDDIETRQFDAPNRNAIEMFGLFTTAFGVPGILLEKALTDNTPLKLNVAGGALCYHHPEWYVLSAFNALRRADAAGMAPPLRAPTGANMACNDGTVARARMSPARQAEELAEAAGDAADAVSFTIGSIFANTVGDAIAPNTYTIRPIGAQTKGLARPAATVNGSRVLLASRADAAAQRWEVIRVNGGYTIRSGGKYLDVATESLLSDGGKVVMWDPNLPFNNHGLNQVWHFYKVGTNRYLLRNVGSGKVLEAPNAAGSNTVRQWSGRNNSRAQVWVIESAR